MLTPLPDNSVILVTFFGNCNGQRIINTFHYRCSVANVPTTDYSAYMDAFTGVILGATNLVPLFLACMPANYTLEKVRTQPVFPTRLRYISTPLTASGTFPGGFLCNAQNTAASIKRVSGAIGPKGVGRIQCVLPDGQASGGTLIDVNNYISALQDLGGQFLLNVVTTTPTQTWVPTLFGPSYTSTGVNDLINWEVEDTVRTMHRRTSFLGE